MAEPLLPKLEASVLAFWQRDGIFAKSLQRPASQGRFVFFEGPPYANGQPGVHHMLSRAYKDAIVRYKTMCGYRVNRKAGWDTHGLPTEMAVEKLLGLKSKREIEETIGVERFVEECRKNVFLYQAEWEKFTERMGYWVDLQDAYVTMTPDYIESVWWIFSEIAKRGLLYQDFKVVPLCTRCGTVLSSHELAQGYKSVTERSVYLKFELVDDAPAGDRPRRLKRSSDDHRPAHDEQKTYILAWTTTPWTLPGNVALAVDPNVTYVKLLLRRKGEEERVILAKDRVEKVFENTEFDGIDIARILQGTGAGSTGGPTIDDYQMELVEILKGEQLVGKTYRPLFDFVDLRKQTEKKAYYIAPADFVTTDDGTGVVHTAVMYGEDDFRLGTQLDLPKVHTVNPDGTFNELVKPWAGKYVKDQATEDVIVAYLKEHGKLYREDQTTHDYPFCWRCDTPLLYYAKDSWFLKTTKVKDAMLKANESINWVPEYLKRGRFGEWLNNVQDWAISRERYWGVPLPIWLCGGTGHRAPAEGHRAQGTGHRGVLSSTHHSPPTTHQLVIGSYAELRKHTTKPLPNSFDPHRPWIDRVELKCPDCGGVMRRVPEVADVWFDSGCMPFAQWHYPFEQRDKVDSGAEYPADFISEGIDQTRGWFYTLLAVATLLGRPAPYKAVVSLGLVNDAEGKKMSKSKGNLILPADLFPKFGSDPVRFYLYTVSQAGEFKNFDPAGVDSVVKKTFLILWNVLAFYQLYASEREPLPRGEPAELHDRWLMAQLSVVTAKVTAALERYDLTTGGRALAEFVTDLSTWYLRRSRERFREPGARRTLAAAYLGHALETTAKLFAPFAPFFAEELYRRVGGPQQSVHLEDWPAVSGSADQGVLATIALARQIVETGHALRKQAGIRLRQPLPQIVVAGAAIPGKAIRLILDELNVKELHVVPAADKLPRGAEWQSRLFEAAASSSLQGLALDTTLTDELRIEGLKREFVRHVNARRKDQRLTIADTVTIRVATTSELLRGIIERYQTELRRELRARAIRIEREVDGPAITLDGESVRVALGKADDGAA